MPSPEAAPPDDPRLRGSRHRDPAAPTAGLDLIEIHAHLLPGIDDGCANLAESLAVARHCVSLGYRHLVCTPHIWTDLPGNTRPAIERHVADLQLTLNRAGIPLTLYPGGEVNLHRGLLDTDPATLPTFASLGTHLLVDAWLWSWPDWLTPVLKHLQTGGRTVILAHPERLGLLQDDLDLVRRFLDLGVLLQGNLYCFADPPHEPTRQLADRYLDDGLYFALAGDLHRPDTLPGRVAGLQKVIDRIGLDGAVRLLRDQPSTLLPRN
ncbi:MAG: CpsB/CapC family capsule biosynthesis tyrosine phosphatase [Tepidisphaerales bacterium]